MANITFTVFKTSNIKYNEISTKYPKDGKGKYLIYKEKDEDECVLFRVQHGTPKSTKLRNEKTGEEADKEFYFSDQENDYAVLHKNTGFLFFTGASKMTKSSLERLFYDATGSWCKIEKFYSVRQLIDTLISLNEVSFYVKKDEDNPLLTNDEVKDALENSGLIDSFNDEVEEIGINLKLKKNSFVSKDRRIALQSYASNPAYENFSIKGVGGDDAFDAVINSEGVATKIVIKELQKENQLINIEKLYDEFCKYFNSGDFESLRRGSHV